jgi:hypothetical protein
MQFERRGAPEFQFIAQIGCLEDGLNIVVSIHSLAKDG